MRCLLSAASEPQRLPACPKCELRQHCCRNKTVNMFARQACVRLGEFWETQEIIYDFKDRLQSTGNWSKMRSNKVYLAINIRNLHSAPAFRKALKTRAVQIND